MDNEWRSKIEKWFSSEPQWFLDQLWRVVFEIEAERVVLGRSRFAIPLDRFKSKNQDIETVRKILINLNSKEILHVGRVLTPQGQRSAGFVEEPIQADEKGIFYDPQTEIGLTHGFTHLYKWLEQRQQLKTDVGLLEEQGRKIMNQFTGTNLNMVLRVLEEIKSSAELSINGGTSYKLQSGFNSAGAARENLLLRKLESLGLFKYWGEDMVTNLASFDNLNFPLIDKCIEIGHRKEPSRESDEIKNGLEDSLAIDKDKKQVSVLNNFNWDPSPDEKIGTLTIPDDSKLLIFRSGNFGGVNELIKNIGHDCKRQQLKAAIAKYKQGESKNPNAISVSKWLSDLKRKRSEFFKYFKVEYSKPDNYRLLYSYQKST